MFRCFNSVGEGRLSKNLSSFSCGDWGAAFHLVVDAEGEEVPGALLSGGGSAGSRDSLSSFVRGRFIGRIPVARWR